MLLQGASTRRFAEVRRVAAAAAAFLFLCAWPLVLFKLRVFGG
jgi:hypothetical protein